MRGRAHTPSVQLFDAGRVYKIGAGAALLAVADGVVVTSGDVDGDGGTAAPAPRRDRVGAEGAT